MPTFSRRLFQYAYRIYDRLTAAIDRVMDAVTVADVIACVSDQANTSDEA